MRGDEFIAYTLDGSVPTLNSPVYKSAIPIAGNVTLRTRVFAENAIPSITAIMSTIFLDELLIESIVWTTWETTCPPLTATIDADNAS